MKFLRPQRRGRAVLLPFLLGILGVIGSVCQAHGVRTELELSGTWQYQKVPSLVYPPTNAWQAVTIPGFLSGWQYERAWFRREFVVPSSMAGARLKLRFGGVKFNAQVWLNGVYIGAYLNGYEPFEFDVTPFALINDTNELIVGVTDWTGTFESAVDFSALSSGENPRNFVQNNILAPIGGRYDLYGIWQPVSLVSVPAVSIAEAFVMPSVRTGQLTVRLTLRNEGATAQTVGVTNRVLEGGSTALTFPGQQVLIASGATMQLDISAPWEDAHLWSHEDPYLYWLETTISSGAGQDGLTTRFGFREFWVESGRFHLNGIPINLLAASTWPPTELEDTNQIRQVLLDVKAGNNVAIRLHTQPWDEPWYDIADEVGLLIVEECAVWCDPGAYKLSDAVFWTNYSRHLAAAVRRDRNHPSIILWSLENEILHCGGDRAYAATEAQLAAMGREVKALDPTRPITYEADLDPGGEADVLGLHYPHDYPDYHIWPNDAYWMDQPIARSWVPGGQWIWDRAKPLYIGEFLWVPSTSAADFTILFGDDTYSDPAWYRNWAKGLTWKMQIEAYRAYGVNGICPWTLFEDPIVRWGEFDLHPDSNYLYQVQKAAYAPNAVNIEEYNTRFFTGASVQRTVRVYNDRMTANDFTLRWRAGSAAWQSAAFSLPPAGQWHNTIAFEVPAAPGPFSLQFELSDAGGVVSTNTLAYSAMAQTTLALAGGQRLAVYDPAGSTRTLLNRFGLPFTTVTNLRTANYESFDVLVVGRVALVAESIPEIGPDSVASKWQAFARGGGWVLILEQTNYPMWVPGATAVQDYDASFAFPNTNHPVTADLTAEDLRWWAGDHRVVQKALTLPSRGNFRPLATVGSMNGVESAVAVEIPCGAGGLLCSQWLLTTRFDQEPLAGVLLQRLLNYCASAAGRVVTHPAAFLAETNSAFAMKLAEQGLSGENLYGRFTGCDPALYPLLIVGGDSSAWDEATAQLGALADYAQSGGKLLLHRPTAAFLSAAQPVLFPELNFNPAHLGRILCRNSGSESVRFANHDLYWIAQPGAWNADEVLSTNIAHRYYRKQFNLPVYSTIEVESMPIHTSGGPSSGGWLLWANGYAAQDITVTQAGTYLFDVLASGTPVQGVWPEMALKIDGRAQDNITVAASQTAFYTLSADLTAGTHQLAISFDNDEYAPPEDRNLFLDKIRWGRDSDTNPAALLTRPGAVAQRRLGNGLVVLDEIRWDVETQNRVKADRYASTLLTGLGAELELRPRVTLEAETMTNINVNAYSASGGLARLNSNGRIETAVNVTADGNYTFEVVAGGTIAGGVLPQIAITVDGISRTNFFLSSTNLIRHTVTLHLAAGTHAIGLAFLNDYYDPPEDRNAVFDQLAIYSASTLRINRLDVNKVQQTATMRWEAVPGLSYEIQFATNLAHATWHTAVTLTNYSSTGMWQDTGDVSRVPPLSPSAPQRFYRIRQAGQ